MNGIFQMQGGKNWILPVLVALLPLSQLARETLCHLFFCDVKYFLIVDVWKYCLYIVDKVVKSSMLYICAAEAVFCYTAENSHHLEA